MDESKTLDLVDVVRARLEGAGIRDVFTYLPDARRHAEFCAIRTGVPGGEDSYFDLAFDTAVRLSLFVARRVELDAMGDALLAERTLREISDKNQVVRISHGDCPEDARQLAALLQKGGVRSDIRYVGTVIGSHTGPGVLAVFFFGGERRPN